MSEQTLPAVVHQRIGQGARRLALGGAALALLISSAALLITLRQPEAPVFISVSMKSLVERHMLATMGRDISHYEAELRTREFSDALSLAIGELSGDRQVIVLAAEAVIGPNVPDFTDDIYARTRQIAEAYAVRRGQALPAPGETTSVDVFLGELAAEIEAMKGSYDLPGTPAPEERP